MMLQTTAGKTGWLFGVCLLCLLQTATAQDKWTGTWHMTYKPWPHIPAIELELKIGQPLEDMLYPAQLTLVYARFSGTYEVLLAKKNDHQLGIGRGKYPIQEKPFSLGAWLLYLNGTLDHNGETAPVITLQRMWISSFGLFMRGLYADDEIFVNSKAFLRDFLYRENISLKKINSKPWTHPHTERILHGDKDSIYYGIYDRITVTDSLVRMSIRDEDAIDRDTVSFLHNGKLLLDKAYISDTEKVLEVPLDTGMNIFSFFADNYGRMPPNTGAFRVNTDTAAYIFDFTDRANTYATFLVAQFYRLPQQEHKDPRINKRENSIVDSITVENADITLELWDDATEDGDSVSIFLNNKPLVNGFAVLKKRQTLSVTLQPGRNRLLFLADNLGSIPPNTAVMRITAGKMEKYIRIKTDLRQNNLLLIHYEPEH